MSDVTRILEQIRNGDASGAERLLREVYDELRRLAADKLARERSGQTLQATALVHEAWLRLVGGNSTPKWDCRGHFFGAAAEAMRRILVENARRKQRLRHGGGQQRVDLDSQCAADDVPGGPHRAPRAAGAGGPTRNAPSARIARLCSVSPCIAANRS